MDQQKQDLLEQDALKQQKKPLLEVSQLIREFPAGESTVQILKSVDLKIYQGELVAIVGQSGSGKSTLMNILYGLYQPTAGKIEIWGREVKFHSAIDAIRAGIGMVHQHFMLIPRLSVADNIVLGTEPRRGVHYDRAKAMREVDALCREYDMKLDSGATVSQISLGMQQRVEIVKSLYRGLTSSSWTSLPLAWTRRGGRVSWPIFGLISRRKTPPLSW